MTGKEEELGGLPARESLQDAPPLHPAGTLNRRHNRTRWIDFVWLVYSCFFFIDPIQRNSTAGWISFSLYYAVFLAIYAGIVMARTLWMSRLSLGAMTVLGFFYIPRNPGAIGVFTFVVAFLPFVVERIAIVVPLLIALCAATILEGWILHLSPWSWAICTLVSLVVGGTNIVFAQQKRASQKLDLAHEEIAHLAKVAERERIARDLHDVLGHTLSVVVLKSELAGRLLDRDPERARAEIREVEDVARKALSEVREAIRGYRAEGLVAEIDRASRTLQAAGVTFVCEAKPPKLHATEETVLSLIVREAVTNIVRHAHASRCCLEFNKNGNRTSLVVEDNGRGGVRQEGNGLRGMRERVESLGGRLQVVSENGTRLFIEIPRQL